MQKLITTLHLTLDNLQSCKKEVWNICDFNTQQAEGVNLLKHINYIESTILELMDKANDIDQQIKRDESNRCMKCED